MGWPYERCHVDSLRIPCTTRTNTIESNPDIAGLGVSLSFLIPNFLVILIAAPCLLYLDRPNQVPAFGLPKSGLRKGICSILLGLSDTQLVTGFALLIAGVVHGCNLTVHHYRVVGQMAGISCATNILVLTILCRHIKTKGAGAVTLAAVRTVAAAGLTIAWMMWTWFGRDMSARKILPMPAGCFFGYQEKTSSRLQLLNGTSSAHVNGTSVDGTTTSDRIPMRFEELHEGGADPVFWAALVGMLLALIVWSAIWAAGFPYRRKFSIFQENPGLNYLTAVIVQTVLPLGVTCLCAVPLIWEMINLRVRPPQLSKEVLKVSEDIKLYLSDNSQYEWEFGQIVPMLLLALVLVTLMEQFTNDDILDDQHLDEDLKPPQNPTTSAGAQGTKPQGTKPQGTKPQA